jgi:peptide/nickel transport system substrate-binding protein
MSKYSGDQTEKTKADMLYIPTPILPEHIWGEVGEKKLADYKNKEPVGTGPYMFAEMQEGSLTITVNGDYFGDPGTVESYSFVEYKNSDSMAQALKAGEIDGSTSISAAQMGQLEDEEGIKVISGQIPGFTQLGFNLKKTVKVILFAGRTKNIDMP